MPRVCLELYMLKIKNSTKESAKRKYNHNYYGFVSLPFCRLFLRAGALGSCVSVLRTPEWRKKWKHGTIRK